MIVLRAHDEAKGGYDVRKFFLCLFLILTLYKSSVLADVNYASNEMIMSLNSDWIDMSTRSEDSNAAFLSPHGSALFIYVVNVMDNANIDEPAIFDTFLNMMSYETRRDMLLDQFNEFLESLGIENQAQFIDYLDGIPAVYTCVLTDENTYCAIAYLMNRQELWIVLCGSSDKAIAESDLIEALSHTSSLLSMDGDQNKSTSENKTDTSSWSDTGLLIEQVPMRVHISENDLNIFTLDTSEDSISYQRLPAGESTIYTRMKLLDASLIVSRPYMPYHDFYVMVRIKDDKYKGMISWREASEKDIDVLIHTMFDPKLIDYSLYYTDSGVFAELNLTFEQDSLRYATIHNGDMIYIQGKSGHGPLTDEDIALVRQVVDSIEFMEPST